MNRRAAFLVMFAAVLLFPCISFAIDIGKPAPDFTVKSYEGKDISLADYKGKVVVLEWFNPDCPFVKKHYDTGHMQKLQQQAADSGVVWLTINSTGPGHENYRKPEQGVKLMSDWKIAAKEMLLDDNGKVGKLYEAKTTPHMFIISAEGILLYDGAIDDQPDTDSKPDTAKNYLADGLRAVSAGKPLSESTTKPYGCSVKYAS